MADIPLKRPTRLHQAAGPLKVWALTSILAAGTLSCWVLALHGHSPVPAPLRLPWPIFAAGFAAGHFAGIRFEFRGESQNVDLTDMILLPAIVFSGAAPVIVAAMAGTIARSLWLRRPVIKSAFNVILHGFAVAVALVCYYSILGHAGALSPSGLLAGAVAIFTAEVITNAAIQLVITLSTGQMALDGMAHLGVTVLLKVGVDAVIGLAAVHMLWTGLAGGLLFMALAVGVGGGYAVHGRLRDRHYRLDQLYRFEQALAGVVETEAVIAAVLQEALLLFNAEVAQLVCTGDDGTVCHTRRSGVSPLVHVVRGPHPFATRASPGAGAVLAGRGVADTVLTDAVHASGLRDAVAVRLPSEGVMGWVFVVADRLGSSHVRFGPDDVALAEALATPTAMALRSSDLLDQLRTQVAIKHHQASHDGLTGLANRTMFSAEVDRALEERAADDLVGVLLIDLDGFKKLNDTLGHEAGDSVLQTFAERLARAVGDEGTAGRLGGDEFAVVLPHPTSAARVTEVAERIDRAVRRPWEVAGTVVHLGASIGVSVAPLHGDDRFVLLRQADLAMYRAKQAGGGVRVQDDRHDDPIDRPSLIAALRETIGTPALRLHYQPTVSFATGLVNGVEALTRWTHPLFGAIGPEEFIPVAEASGLIVPLTRWVLDTALAQAAEWHQAGFGLNMAVNLSPEQLGDPDIVTQVSQLLSRHRLPPATLTLEITESESVGNHGSESLHVLESLTALGVQIALDDFGVGSSSLTRLKRLPVDELKIDKSFTANLTTNPTDRAIVASTIELAHQLGLSVIAEGVETDDAYQQLSDLGCDTAQGYLISKPLDPADLTRWLHDHTTTDLPRRLSPVARRP